MSRKALDHPFNRTRFSLKVLPGLPSCAEGHGCKPVDECEVGTLRSLGEGGCASEGSARRRVWRGATAVRPWGSTVKRGKRYAVDILDKRCLNPENHAVSRISDSFDLNIGKSLWMISHTISTSMLK